MSDSDRPVVLIVEDEPYVAETYRLWLREDYEVEMAHDGDEGLSKLDADVDVVLLDRMMPGLSGDEVLEQIRERDLDCRVSMVTAVEPDFDILEMGFDAYLLETYQERGTHETVENLLDRSAYDALLQNYYPWSRSARRSRRPRTTRNSPRARNTTNLRRRLPNFRTTCQTALGGIGDDADFIATLRGLSNDEAEEPTETMYDLSRVLDFDALSSVRPGTSLPVAGPAMTGKDELALRCSGTVPARAKAPSSSRRTTTPTTSQRTSANRCRIWRTPSSASSTAEGTLETTARRPRASTFTTSPRPATSPASVSASRRPSKGSTTAAATRADSRCSRSRRC